MKKTYIMLGLAAVLLISLCCIFTGQYILNGCFWWECAPQRDFHVLDLGLPADVFPEGAVIGPISPPTDGYGQIEAGQQDIYVDRIDRVVAVYNIYRFPRRKEAVSQFERDRKDMVNPQTGIGWKPPDNLTFSSTTADDLYIACGYFSVYRCEMAARYQEYTIFLGVDISDKMTYAEFEKVVIYIDKQISNRLY